MEPSAPLWSAEWPAPESVRFAFRRQEWAAARAAWTAALVSPLEPATGTLCGAVKALSLAASWRRRARSAMAAPTSDAACRMDSASVR
eukprot:15717026-Heterocapsa_arctica.AAC.1